MKTVIGLFDDYAQAQKAAHDLERAGASRDDISLVVNNASGAFGSSTSPLPAPNAEAETAKGAVAGGVTGLLLGLASFAIPGLGPIAAAGWLTLALTGAVVGAGVGLVGALTGIWVPYEDAVHYNEGVPRGGTLLAVKVPDELAPGLRRSSKRTARSTSTSAPRSTGKKALCPHPLHRLRRRPQRLPQRFRCHRQP